MPELTRFRCFTRVLTIFLLLCGVIGCREAVVHNVEEVTANRIALVLAQASIEATKIQEGNFWNVVVDSDRATDALAVIEEQRVLRPSSLNRGVGNGSLIQSREERLRLIEEERAETLELTLERLPGVREARVHLLLAPDDQIENFGKKKRQSAGVLVIKGGKEDVQEELIRRLVAGGTGIEATQISVVITAHPSPFATRNGAEANNVNSRTVSSSQQLRKGQRKKSYHTPQIYMLGGAVLGILSFGSIFSRRKKLQNKLSSVIDSSPQTIQDITKDRHAPEVF